MSDLNNYIDESAKVIDTDVKNNSKIYKNCYVVSSVIGDNSTIGDFSRVSNSLLYDNVSIKRYSTMFNTTIGRYTYTGNNFTSWYCSIGKFCSISWNVSIGGANHDYSRITTHAFLYSKQFGLLDGAEPLYDRFLDECIIGNDVWIGCGATICRGVKIGDGAVIAAGAVVTHDVEPYSIVAGVPAKQIKKRFDNKTIDVLLESKWWDFPDFIIKDNIKLFSKFADYKTANEILNLRKKLDEVNY